MKKLLQLILFAICSFSAACMPQSKEYLYEGEIDPAFNGKMVKLFDYIQEKDIDSVQVVDGRFAFRGTLAEPTIFLIWCETYNVFIAGENAHTRVRLGKQSALLESDDTLSREINRYLLEVNSLDNRSNRLSDSLKIAKATQEAWDSCGAKIQNAFLKHREATLLYNRNNLFGGLLMNELIGKKKEISLREVDSMLGIVPLALQYKTTRRIQERLGNAARTQPGNQYVDFAAYNQKNQLVKFSDFVGEKPYTVLCLWAQRWCQPCVRQLVELQKQLASNDRVKLIGLNIDRDMESMQKGIEWNDLQDNRMTTLLHLHDYTLHSDLLHQYGLNNTIPLVLLLDSQGKILARISTTQSVDSIVEAIR